MAKSNKKIAKPETNKPDGKSAKDKPAASPAKPEQKKKPAKAPKKEGGKAPKKQSPPPPAKKDASLVTSDHIVALRRRLNYEIFLKCLEKKYLSDEEETEDL